MKRRAAHVIALGGEHERVDEVFDVHRGQRPAAVAHHNPAARERDGAGGSKFLRAAAEDLAGPHDDRLEPLMSGSPL